MLREMLDPNMLESMTSLSLVQKISTGYVLLDVVLCALLPVLIQRARPLLQAVWWWLSTDRESAKFARHIKFIKREGYYHYDPAEKNHLLQEAILMYIASQEHLVKKFSVRFCDSTPSGEWRRRMV